MEEISTEYEGAFAAAVINEERVENFDKAKNDDYISEVCHIKAGYEETIKQLNEILPENNDLASEIRDLIDQIRDWESCIYEQDKQRRKLKVEK